MTCGHFPDSPSLFSAWVDKPSMLTDCNDDTASPRNGENFMDELDGLMAEWEALKAREALIANESRLMWLVLGALYNVVRDNGRCVIEAGSETDKVITEIVSRVEGWM